MGGIGGRVEIKWLKTQINRYFYFVGYYYIKIKKMFVFLGKDLDGEKIPPIFVVSIGDGRTAKKKSKKIWKFNSPSISLYQETDKEFVQIFKKSFFPETTM